MLIYFAAIDTPEARSKFEKVYTQYRGLMYHVAYQILRNSQDAEDAVHNAFVKIAQYIEKIDDPVCPKTRRYVVTIAENKAVDLYRANRRRREMECPDEWGAAVPLEEPLGLEACIIQLPPRYRQVILLKYYHGFTTQEVTGLLGISLANAVKLEQRAKKRLLELCREEGIL